MPFLGRRDDDDRMRLLGQPGMCGASGDELWLGFAVDVRYRASEAMAGLDEDVDGACRRLLRGK